MLMLASRGCAGVTARPVVMHVNMCEDGGRLMCVHTLRRRQSESVTKAVRDVECYCGWLGALCYTKYSAQHCAHGASYRKFGTDVELGHLILYVCMERESFHTG